MDDTQDLKREIALRLAQYPVLWSSRNQMHDITAKRTAAFKELAEHFGIDGMVSIQWSFLKLNLYTLDRVL